MEKIWYFLYNILFIPLFWVSLQFLRLFNAKIRHGIQGREQLFERLEVDIRKLTSKHRIWFHSSSMGEFEQAKPIIAALRKKYSDLNIIVTFFSPSGYDHSKHYKLADIITYIPFDTNANAQRFINLIRPTVAVMVRYDIWPNHLRQLHEMKIPTFIANATMRKNSSRFLPGLKSFHRILYDQLTSILTVSPADVEAFKRFKLTRPLVQAIGETRYDQVWQRSTDAKQKNIISEHIIVGKKVFVAGSTWPEDEEILLPTIKKLVHYRSNFLTILVPHEPTLETLENLELRLENGIRSIRFSELNEYNGEPVILVDSVGILVALYHYAHVAYVGGSFRQGIHNVLEPAVYGIPVVYGPRNANSQEAVELARRGGGFVITDQQECFQVLRSLLYDKRAKTTAGNIALALVKENIGATERFLQHLESVL